MLAPARLQTNQVVFISVVSLLNLFIFQSLAFTHHGNHFSPYTHTTAIGRKSKITPTHCLNPINAKLRSSRNVLQSTSDNIKNNVELESVTDPLTQSDIKWKLVPSKDQSIPKRLFVKAAAKLVRIYCRLRREQIPFVLAPKGGQAVLEAYVSKKPNGKRKNVKIARFGITTKGGQPCPEINESIKDIFNVEAPMLVGVAAIIYMFVEPDFRKRGVGKLALDVISAVHANQGCSFTVLVADDDGSNKLVEWYEKHGFNKAPNLQNVMGSPEKKFGTTMIAPVRVEKGFHDVCKIAW